jgi:hypothetical protein
MQQLQAAFHQFQNFLVVAGIVVAVLVLWWVVSKIRGAVGSFLAMPIGKKLWLATLVLMALWFAGMAGVEPMHGYLVAKGAPSTPAQVVGLAFAIKRAGLYWLDTNTWVPLALGVIAFLTLIWRRV